MTHPCPCISLSPSLPLDQFKPQGLIFFMFEIKKKEKNSSVLFEYLPCHHPVAGSTYASTVRSICFLLLPAVRPSFPFGTFLVEQTFCKKIVEARRPTTGFAALLPFRPWTKMVTDGRDGGPSAHQTTNRPPPRPRATSRASAPPVLARSRSAAVRKRTKLKGRRPRIHPSRTPARRTSPH
jgi:hypothetical protein